MFHAVLSLNGRGIDRVTFRRETRHFYLRGKGKLSAKTKEKLKSIFKLFKAYRLLVGKIHQLSVGLMRKLIINLNFQKNSFDVLDLLITEQERAVSKTAETSIILVAIRGICDYTLILLKIKRNF